MVKQGDYVMFCPEQDWVRGRVELCLTPSDPSSMIFVIGDDGSSYIGLVQNVRPCHTYVVKGNTLTMEEQ